MEEQQEPRNKRIWPKLLLAVAIIGFIMWLIPSGKEKPGKGSPAVPVTLVKPKQQDVPFYLNGVGTIEALYSAELHTQIDGQLTAIHFKEGQEVKKGQLLAEIDSRTIRAELASARAEKARIAAQLETARLDATRYDNLLKADAISKQTADQQTATVKQLEASVAAANAAIDASSVQLSYTRITSPITGKVGIRRVDPGNIVKRTDPEGIVKVTQVKPIAAIFSISQSALPTLGKAMASKEDVPVEAMLKEETPAIATGKLASIDNEVDQATGTIKLRAVFENETEQLWPGQMVVLRLKAGTLQKALTIPVKAIQRGREGDFVYRITPENTAEIAQIKIAFENEDVAVIESGISETDDVVLDGQSRLKPGSNVKAAPKNESAQ